MKKIFTAMIILGTSFLINSCASGPGGDPKQTLTAFFEALGNKDMDAARKLATADSKSMIDLIDAGMKMAKDNKEAKDMDKFDKSKMLVYILKRLSSDIGQQNLTLNGLTA